MTEELVSVFLITRHGARTPLHLVDGINETEYNQKMLEPFVESNIIVKSLDNQKDLTNTLSYKDEKYLHRKLKGGAYVGQLTKIGEEQMFKLGVRIKERYVNELKFLDEEYNSNEIYVRSTHLRRTVNSAKSVLAGLYQNNASEKLNKPFLINVNELETDYLYPNLHECPFIKDKREFIRKNFKFYCENEPSKNEYLNFVNYIKNKFNFRKNDFLNPLFIYEFLDEIHSRIAHSLPIPCDLEKVVDKANSYASIELGIEMMENLEINCGKFINLLKHLFLEIVFKHKNKMNDFFKLHYFSAHDNTLIALLIVLNKINEKNYILPPFGSDIIFELWKKIDTNQNSYYVKVFYNGKLLKIDHDYGFVKEKLPLIKLNSKIKTFNDLNEKSDSKLDFTNFIRLLAKYGIDDNIYKSICNKFKKEN